MTGGIPGGGTGNSGSKNVIKLLLKFPHSWVLRDVSNNVLKNI